MKQSTKTVIWIFLGIGAAVLIGLRWYASTLNTKPPLMKVSGVPEFSLITQDSVPFTKSNLLGKITIADFVFTTCGGPCPLMSSRMQKIQSQINTKPNVRLLSFSVDPEYDTPSILKEYAHTFGANEQIWTFLTGTKESIYSLAKKGFHLAVEDDEEAILHSTKFVLIDREAIIRGYYDYDDSTSTQKLLDDVNMLLEN